jgi:hypothetical protein
VIERAEAGEALRGIFLLRGIEGAGLRVLDCLQRGIDAGIIDGGEIANEDGDLVEFVVALIAHAARAAVATPAAAFGRFGEVVGLAEGVGFELELPAELEHEIFGLLLGVRAGEGGGHDHPRAAVFFQLIGFVRVGIDFLKRDERGPRRGGCGGHG